MNNRTEEYVAACIHQNTLNDLLEELYSHEENPYQCQLWGLTEEQRLKAIKKAFTIKVDRILDGENEYDTGHEGN